MQATRFRRTLIWLATVLQDVRVAWRMLRRAPFSTAIAICSIALGVGATAVVFAAVKSVLLAPLPYAHPERLVQLGSSDDLAGAGHSDWLFWNDTREIIRRTHTLASVGVYSNAVLDLGGAAAGEPPQALYGLRVTASLFPTLGVSPLIGRNLLPEEDQPGRAAEMLLSYGLWTKRFGRDPKIVGKSIRVNGHGCLVIGVMPAGFNFPLRRGATRTPQPYVEFWAPLLPAGTPAEGSGVGAVARLRPGVPVAEAQADLAAISTALRHDFPRSNRGRTLHLTPLEKRVVGGAGSALLLLMVSAGMFLLIGCANIANLLLARGLAQRREIEIRLAVGASRLRIVRQMVVEGCVLAVAGGFGAFAVTALAWRLLPSIAPVTIPRLANTRADWSIFGFAMAVAVFSGVCFAIAPALRSARLPASSSLGGLGARNASSGRRDRLRSSLVMSEVAVSVVLVLTGGQLLGSFVALLDKDPGFQADRVLAAVVIPARERYATPERRGRVYERFLNAVRAIPGVIHAGTVDALPFSGENHGGFVSAQESGGTGTRSVAEINIVGGDYLQALGVRLLAGRWFGEHETHKANKTAIVNDALARRIWGAGNAIGRRLCVDCTPEQPDNWKQVAGVVSTVRHAALDESLPDNVYLPAHDLQTADFLVVRSGRPLSEIDKAIRKAIATVDPDQPVLLSASLQTLIDDTLADRRFVVMLLTGTGALALLLAMAGVYGVTSYVTSRRTPEIGIRMAVGATPGDVHALIFRQGFVHVALGLAAGFGLTLLCQPVLRALIPSLASGKTSYEIVSACLVLVSTALAFWIPARHAAGIDPMAALRQE